MTNLLLLGFLPSGSEWIIIALVILYIRLSCLPNIEDAIFTAKTQEHTTLPVQWRLEALLKEHFHCGEGCHSRNTV